MHLVYGVVGLCNVRYARFTYEAAFADIPFYELFTLVYLCVGGE